jgi:ataxia telangiectasia mutated family protein
VSRAALTALASVVTDGKVPSGLPQFLHKDLTQYAHWGRPTKNRRRPPDGSPAVSQWVASIVSGLTPDRLSVSFGNLAARSPPFAEQLFPFALEDALGNVDVARPLVERLCGFAADAARFPAEARLVLGALAFLRRTWFDTRREHSAPRWGTEWHGLRLDFGMLAGACLALGDPYSAFQYADFAADAGAPVGDATLRAVFARLDVGDLARGLAVDVSDAAAVARVHSGDGRRGRALALYDAAGDGAAMCRALGDLRLYNFLQRVERDNLESLWRLQRWDVAPDVVRAAPASVFPAVQAIASGSAAAAAVALSAFAAEFRFAPDASVSRQFGRLLEAETLERCAAARFPRRLTALFGAGAHARHLERLLRLARRSFAAAESACALQCVFFCIAGGADARFFAELIAAARDAGALEAAQYFVSLLRRSGLPPALADFEQLELLYADAPGRALALLERAPPAAAAAACDGLFGLRVAVARAAWGAELHARPAHDIVGPLEAAADAAHDAGAPAIAASAHFTLARFFRTAHARVCDEFLSDEFTMISKIIDENQQLLREDRSAPDRKVRQVKEDTRHYEESVRALRRRFSETITAAARHFMLTLARTDAHDLEALFSLVGLWFGYSFARFRPFVQEVPDLLPAIEDCLPDVPPAKFVPLFYQLAARVDAAGGGGGATQGSSYNEAFQHLLQRIVVDVAIADAHQCLPVLYALAHTAHTAHPVSGEKGECIVGLIDAVAAADEAIEGLWRRMRELLDAYVRLTLPREAHNARVLLLSLAVIGGGAFERCAGAPVVTAPRPVAIGAFEDAVAVLAGVNNPLLLKLRDEEGRLHKQIIKGKDDLRQDAVMQQLFVLASTVLRRRDADLGIRSYRVVPLTQSCGVIEFVDRTTSIQDWHHTMYKGDAGAGFYRYPPRDTLKDGAFWDVVMSFSSASDKYHNSKGKDGAFQKVVDVFQRALEKLPPIFRFFFVEKFPNTGDWFAARMRFCRHTATNSMVGYLFGVGDRHLNNVLIDTETGELVHIDLGIAFDQGKALPIPEVVPFRLTQALVDGMGINGFEGVFRRACHETIAVMRKSRDYIIVILDVVLSDPISTWTIVPKRQLDPDAPIRLTARTAESIIIKCRRKLDGREMGEEMSVEGQVASLIAEATNKESLAVMFRGWKPFI